MVVISSGTALTKVLSYDRLYALVSHLNYLIFFGLLLGLAMMKETRSQSEIVGPIILKIIFNGET